MNFEQGTSKMNFEQRTPNKELRMKKALRHSKLFVLYSAIPLLVASQGVAKETEPAGVAAQLTVSNGKVISVRLQALEDNKVTFKAGAKEMTVPVNKVSRFKFALNKEEYDFFTTNQVISSESVKEFTTPDIGKREKLDLIFNQILENVADEYNKGNYAEVVSAMASYLSQRAPYMQVENNLQETFLILMESYRGLDNFSDVRKCAAPLLKSDNAELVLKAQVNNALASLAEDDFQMAEKLCEEIESEAAALYLKACIQQAKGEPKAAMQIITDVIAEHGNDIDWMAPSELLSAQLYMDMISTNGVGIGTNSAINTARQVKNMYGGTAVAADAKKLWIDLGGEAIEAEQAAKLKAFEEEQAAKRADAEQAAAEAAAAEAAAIAAETNTVDATTTEIESE